VCYINSDVVIARLHARLISQGKEEMFIDISCDLLLLALLNMLSYQALEGG
jgi:hypothetical protein